jgi:oxygen-independent coproporphyrinogen-3 oxidase
VASLYLHIPFCIRKCVYCDFYSLEDQSFRGAFLDALLREIDLRQDLLGAEEVSTVYFGGGTPSLLEPSELERIILALRERYRINGDAEVTVEANPGTIGPGKLAAYRSLGVNRLSLGVQSFDEEELRFLGRIHTPADALRGVSEAREAGFENISLDLIFSLPGQSAEKWESTVRQALELRPDHCSAYSLIVEENTPLFRLVREGYVSPNGAEAEAILYERTMTLMAEAGLEQYEVSSFARPGRRCLHNIAYWSHDDYLGLGPSAHSFLRGKGGEPARRWWNAAEVGAYCRELADGRLPAVSGEQVDRDDLLRERIFLGLRSGGIDLPACERELGFVPDARQRLEMAACVAGGLAREGEGVFRLTAKGYVLCDEIAARLIP